MCGKCAAKCASKMAIYKELRYIKYNTHINTLKHIPIYKIYLHHLIIKE